MPAISNQTLVIAIQAVASETRALREALASGHGQAQDYQMLEDQLRAAEDLKRAYDIAARTVINLPPYKELVSD